jgi:hypothetical protein
MPKALWDARADNIQEIFEYRIEYPDYNSLTSR